MYAPYLSCKLKRGQNTVIYRKRGIIDYDELVIALIRKRGIIDYDELVIALIRKNKVGHVEYTPMATDQDHGRIVEIP